MAKAFLPALNKGRFPFKPFLSLREFLLLFPHMLFPQDMVILNGLELFLPFNNPFLQPFCLMLKLHVISPAFKHSLFSILFFLPESGHLSFMLFYQQCGFFFFFLRSEEY